MLIEFSVTNFKSIGNEINFSMEANTRDKSLFASNTFFNEKFKKNLLKSAAIYGPNASGKSNFIESIMLLKKLIKTSSNFKANNEIDNYYPFKFNNNLQPTKFHIIFIKNSTKYIYGFSYNNKEILNEYLYYYNTNRVSTFFERSFDISNISNPKKAIKINNTYFYFTQKRNRQKIIAENTNKNCLYLSRASEMSLEDIFPVYDWFNSIVLFNEGTRAVSYTSERSLNDQFFKKSLIRFLNIADFGIEDFTVNKQPLDKELINKLKSGIIEISNEEELKIINLNFKHKNKYFSWEEESAGTKKFFSIIGPIIDILQKGKILFFDEMDVQLHPELIILVLELFNNSDLNPFNAQLILTTHNTILFNQKYLRRDQIWFIEKDSNSNKSKLYSLLEFKQRKKQNYQQNYLDGRYGAIPFIDKKDLKKWLIASEKEDENIKQE